MEGRHFPTYEEARAIIADSRVSVDPLDGRPLEEIAFQILDKGSPSQPVESPVGSLTVDEPIQPPDTSFEV